MRFEDALHLASDSLFSTKGKTFLTILGLAIGVAAVLTVLTLGDAGEHRVEEEIDKLGVNKVWIRSGDERHVLMPADAEMLKREASVTSCAGAYTIIPARMGSECFTAQIAGYDSSMQMVHRPKIRIGRSFLKEEFDQGSPVCLIDSALQEYVGKQVLGEWLQVGQRRFRVVGVIKNMMIQTMSPGNGTIIIPLNTFFETFGGEVAEITLNVGAEQDAARIAQLALDILSNDHGYRAETLTDEIIAAKEIVRIFVMVLVCVAAVCMVTGGIGIMNVLLINIRERRNEIGLIKAIGGTNRQVATLFILEAILYALIGGAGGLALGFFMIQAFGIMIGLEAQILPGRTIAVLIVTALLGICAGVIPAWNAARMPPVEALNCE